MSLRVHLWLSHASPCLASTRPAWRHAGDATTARARRSARVSPSLGHNARPQARQ